MVDISANPTEISTYGSLSGFKSSKLIMPGPGSVGFLGSLAIDLLIHSYSLRRVAILDTPYLEQIVGTKVYNQHDSLLYTALEAYQGEKLPGFTVVQIRSHPLSGCGLSFSKALVNWILKNEFSSVILVAGLDKSRRTDDQLMSSPLRFTSNLDKSLLKEQFSSMNTLLPMESIKASHNLYTTTLPPGAGITQFLMNGLADAKIEAVVVTYFTEAGDNYLPAFDLANLLLPVLSQKTVLKAPFSWKSLYGNDETEVRELF